MKILGIIIASVCIIVNIIIGVFLYSNNLSFLDSSKQAQDQAKVDVSSSSSVLYTSTTHGVSFMYPKVWSISTLPEDRIDDSQLIEAFSSSDESDGFLEGFFVYDFPSSDFNFDTIVNNLRANLPSDGSVIVSEAATQVAGYKGHQFVTSSVVPAFKGTGTFDIKSTAYVVDMGKSIILFEFSDQIATYEVTNTKFLDIVNSLKPLK